MSVSGIYLGDPPILKQCSASSHVWISAARDFGVPTMWAVLRGIVDRGHRTCGAGTEEKEFGKKKRKRRKKTDNSISIYAK